ncbi:hypothetical protein [Bradyrhizobium canariense]|uniref:hypothetical protein n=1 Tax=Bradyrhizobium canariense TaxID=255045 RepID=UPI0011785651|nr:hypothetical protein [Bradyrhizobium canariense]
MLSEIGLIYKRRQPETNNRSFREVARLAIVEGEIIQKRSPLLDGTLAADIANTSTLKLLITVIDCFLTRVICTCRLFHLFDHQDYVTGCVLVQ